VHLAKEKSVTYSVFKLQYFIFFIDKLETTNFHLTND